MPEPAQYNIHDAKTHLSQLVARAESGGEVVLSRAGKPVAKIVPFRPSKPSRVPGIWQGRVTIHDDFDELPADVVGAFRGDAP